ncbi:hypothetical protein HK100_009401, partial [Physocladia obscura]
MSVAGWVIQYNTPDANGQYYCADTYGTTTNLYLYPCNGLQNQLFSVGSGDNIEITWIQNSECFAAVGTMGYGANEPIGTIGCNASDSSQVWTIWEPGTTSGGDQVICLSNSYCFAVYEGVAAEGYPVVLEVQDFNDSSQKFNFVPVFTQYTGCPVCPIGQECIPLGESGLGCIAAPVGGLGHSCNEFSATPTVCNVGLTCRPDSTFFSC